MPILKTSTFDQNNLRYSQVMKNRQGSNQVHINYLEDGEMMKKIILQSPKLSTPFGISEYPTENGPKYSLDCSFIDISEDTKVNQFYSMLKSIDDNMIKTAVENSKDWFGKKMSEEIVKEFYRPLIKEGKQKPNSEECYPDTVKFKIRTIGDKKNVEAYDTDRKKIDIDDLKTGSKVRSIVEVSPIWFVNKNFGLTLNMVQVEISKPDKISGFSFEDDSDCELEEDAEY